MVGAPIDEKREKKEVRCPECGEWGALGKRSLKCIHCGNRFGIREGAFMDGVYLDKWKVQDRYEKYIEEGVDKLEISDKNSVTNKAIEMVEDLPGTFKSGKNPRTISSGAVYISTVIGGERRTQREVAEAFRISEKTILKRYKEIWEELEDQEKYLRSL